MPVSRREESLAAIARDAARRARLAIPLLALALCASAASCQFGEARSPGRAADGIVVETTDSSIVQDVSRSDRPSVVYYYAYGCIPCMALGPHVRRLAARFAGRVVFWSLNHGWSAARVRRYGVPMVPTLVFYVGDREVIRQVGMPAPDTDDSLARFVEAGLRASSPPAKASGVKPGKPG